MCSFVDYGLHWQTAFTILHSQKLALLVETTSDPSLCPKIFKNIYFETFITISHFNISLTRVLYHPCGFSANASKIANADFELQCPEMNVGLLSAEFSKHTLKIQDIFSFLQLCICPRQLVKIRKVLI